MPGNKRGRHHQHLADRLVFDKLAFCALFAALCLTSTLLINVPLPNGYFNVGDVFVLLSGWFLGGWGILAAAIGSALADIISSFALYAPATFFIKGLTACCAYFLFELFKKLIKTPRWKVVARLFSAIAAETVMIVGYFLFESVLYGFAGAALSLAGNGVQGIACAVCGTTLCSLLAPMPVLRKIFPSLD